MRNKKYYKWFGEYSLSGSIFIVFASFLSMTSSPLLHAQDYFNPELLQLGNPQQGHVDLSVFEAGNQPSGTYRVEIDINGEQVDIRNVEFELVTDEQGKELLQPCLTVDDLYRYGVKTKLFTSIRGSGKCANIKAIPHASSELNFNSQRLSLSIPQAAMSLQARGLVSPERWEQGISALLMNYNFSGSNIYSDKSSSNNQYLNLRPGLNIGAWRFRNYSTWNRSSAGEDKWSSVYIYAQRDLIALRSRLTLGDSSSQGDIFDSVPFRGAQLSSDEDMLPDSLRGYAPAVRGIARSNAEVVIRQNGYVIYQSYVPPGAFEITDMYPTGGSGNLDVTIKEADGSEQHLIVPFASLPQLQREGRFNYSLTGGHYRAYDSNVEKTPFAQGTAVYGLPVGITAYGGLQVADNYRAAAAGIGQNLGNFGAISTDLTYAQASLKQHNNGKQMGQSWRIRYSKNILETGTNFAIAGYRYSTDGYYSMTEVMDTYRSTTYTPFNERQRNRAEISLNQNLGPQFGSLSLNLISQDYWNSDKRMQSIGMGYGSSWENISYGLNYSYNRNSRSGNSSGERRVYDKDQIVAFNINIPWGKSSSSVYANYGLNSSKSGGTSHSISLSGNALADKNLSWAVQQNYASNARGRSGSLNSNYRSTFGEISAGYGYASTSQRFNYGGHGGVIVHEDGITLGQSLGETVGLVKAPGAGGVEVYNQTGVKTDRRGYAVVPYLTPYRSNDITLNTSTLDNNIEIPQASLAVVPTRGALIRAEYVTQVGRRVLMTLKKADGNPVPFGATVTVLNAPEVQQGIIGDGGVVFLAGLEEVGQLQIKWGDAQHTQCRASYQLPAKSTTSGVLMSDTQC